MITVYGIKTCSTCRNALKWLSDQGITHAFHDYRKDGFSKDLLARFIAEFGAENLLNKRSATWRDLADAQKDALMTGQGEQILLESPTVLKRPIFIFADKATIGFKPQNKDVLSSWVA